MGLSYLTLPISPALSVARINSLTEKLTMSKPTVFLCFMSSNSIESFQFTSWFSCYYFTYMLVLGQDYHTSETLSFCLVNCFPGCQAPALLTPFKLLFSLPVFCQVRYSSLFELFSAMPFYQ
ncbi:hypothetical protein ACB092_03G097700 [Castanea dentata]